jgi:hypothetical protein
MFSITCISSRLGIRISQRSVYYSGDNFSSSSYTTNLCHVRKRKVGSAQGETAALGLLSGRRLKLRALIASSFGKRTLRGRPHSLTMAKGSNRNLNTGPVRDLNGKQDSSQELPHGSHEVKHATTKRSLPEHLKVF